MALNNENKERLIKATSKIVGIRESRIKDYSETNDLENIIKRPNSMNLTEKQIEKIEILNDLILNHNISRQFADENKIAFKNTEDIGKYFQNLIGHRKDKEIFMCAFLDKDNHLIKIKEISQGTLGVAVIFPREVVKEAINNKCKAVVFSHNHPSGDTTPSPEDINLTKDYINTFNPLGIKVLDHIIVGDDITSLRERKDINIEGEFKFRPLDNKGITAEERYYNSHRLLLSKAVSDLSGIGIMKVEDYLKKFFNDKLSSKNNIIEAFLKPEMVKENGEITKAEYKKLFAIKEFIESYNISLSNTNSKDRINGPLKMMQIFKEKVQDKEEALYMMLFNTKLGLIGTEKISKNKDGNISLRQKEILLKTLSYDASSVSIIHLNSTNRNKAFALGKDLAQNTFNMLGPLQLKIVDYLLVNDNSYISMKEKGVMPYTVIGAPDYSKIEIMSEKVDQHSIKDEFKYEEIEDEEFEEEDEWELVF